MIIIPKRLHAGSGTVQHYQGVADQDPVKLSKSSRDGG